MKINTYILAEKVDLARIIYGSLSLKDFCIMLIGSRPAAGGAYDLNYNTLIHSTLRNLKRLSDKSDFGSRRF